MRLPRKAFALEDDAQGKGIADNYAAADRVRYAECQPGNEIYAWLATAQTITIGDSPRIRRRRERCRVRAATGAAVATALEAVTTTASQARIKVRVMLSRGAPGKMDATTELSTVAPLSVGIRQAPSFVHQQTIALTNAPAYRTLLREAKQANRPWRRWPPCAQHAAASCGQSARAYSRECHVAQR